MEQKNPNNSNIFLTPAFEKYSNDQKEKYKIFMSNMLRLARETKKYSNENFNFVIVKISGEINIISYSILVSKWLIDGNEFNPEVISGIMNFLEDYDFNKNEIQINY